MAERKLPAGFKKITRAPFFKWDHVGQEFTGTFIRLEETRKYDGAVILKAVNVDGERQSVACPTVLKQLLEGVEAGTQIHIVYSGEEDTGEESPMKLFDVFTK